MKQAAVIPPNPHGMASMAFTMGSAFISSGYFLGTEGLTNRREVIYLYPFCCLVGAEWMHSQSPKKRPCSTVTLFSSMTYNMIKR